MDPQHWGQLHGAVQGDSTREDGTYPALRLVLLQREPEELVTIAATQNVRPQPATSIRKGLLQSKALPIYSAPALSLLVP